MKNRRGFGKECAYMLIYAYSLYLQGRHELSTVRIERQNNNSRREISESVCFDELYRTVSKAYRM